MSAKDRNSVKNQHYVPCCVLIYFKESNIISRKEEPRIYHFLNEKEGIYPTTVSNVMCDKEFYEHQNLRINWLEDLLKDFEGNYASLLRKIVTSITIYKNRNIQFSELKKLIFTKLQFFFVMRFRSGGMLYEQEYAHKSNAVLGIIEKLLLSSTYIKDLSQTVARFYDFCILESSNMDFLISDQFISTASLSFKGSFIDATNRTIGLNNVLILIPISKEYYICFWNAVGKTKLKFLKKDKINKLTKQQTIEINRVIINNSYIQTAGSSIQSLENVVGDFNQVYPHSVCLGWDEYKPGRFHGADLGKEVFFYDNDRKVYEAVTISSRLYKAENNDSCPCGSGVTFRNCCRYVLKAFMRYGKEVFWADLIQRKSIIPGCFFLEQNIFQW